MSGVPAPVQLPGLQLLGRERERGALDRLLDAARGGHGGVLVVCGEPGVGKTALLGAAIEAGWEFRIARTSGVEAEMEFPYAAAQQLCFPILHLMVARRLLAEKLALVFATREPGDTLAGLPEIHVEPLGHRDARALLESVLPSPLDERVLERIVVETRGNPLALLELPRGLTPAQLAGGFGLPPVPWQNVPVTSRAPRSGSEPTRSRRQRGAESVFDNLSHSRATMQTSSKPGWRLPCRLALRASGASLPQRTLLRPSAFGLP